MEKKIATSVEVLIKVAQFESIRITKYGESKIEYSSDEEMSQQEDKLNDDVIADLVRSMRSLPAKLGKKTNSVVEIEEKIQKRIPEWLENNPEPNLANRAIKSHEKSEFEAHKENEDRKAKSESTNTTITETAADIEDLFGDGPVGDKVDSTQEEKPINSEDTKKTTEENEKAEGQKDDNFLDDEDLFA